MKRIKMTDHGPRIHLSISSHGYGHLTQAIALARALLKQDPDIVFRIQCNFSKQIIAERLGNSHFVHEKCSMDIGLIQKDPITPDLDATYKAYSALHHNYNERVANESEQLKKWQPDLVISDIPYLPLAAASRIGIPSVALASLTWDSIIKAYFDINEAEPAQWYAEARASYSDVVLALLPAPAMSGDCFLNKKQLPPIAVLGQRQATLRAALGINKADRRPLIICSLGGIPGAEIPLSVLQAEKDFHWLTNISHLWTSDHIHSLDNMAGWQYRDIIASVDGVISKPGYGMAVEAAALGLPFVFFRRGHFPDEPYIVDWLQSHARIKEISSDAWLAGEFVKPLSDLFALPMPEIPSCNGAEVGALVIKNQFF